MLEVLDVKRDKKIVSEKHNKEYMKRNGLANLIENLKCPKCKGILVKVRDRGYVQRYNCVSCNATFEDIPRTIGFWCEVGEHRVRMTEVKHNLQEV